VEDSHRYLLSLTALRELHFNVIFNSSTRCQNSLSDLKSSLYLYSEDAEIDDSFVFRIYLHTPEGIYSLKPQANLVFAKDSDEYILVRVLV